MRYYVFFGALAAILAAVLAILFASLLNGSAYWTWLAAINVTTALLYALDKFLAKVDGPRMPEWIGLLLPILGGFVGGTLAMFLLRHKTQHRQFWFAQFLGLALHVALFVFVVRPGL